MGYDGAGNWTRQHNWVQDKGAGVKIVASRMDAEFDDMASGLSKCIVKDGQQDPTANLPMAGFKHTGVTAASARDQYMDLGGYQDGKYVFGGTASGTSAIAITLNPTISAYVTGMEVHAIAAGDNASAVTVNVDAVSAAALTKGNNLALDPGDLSSGRPFKMTYMGTAGWHLHGPTAVINGIPIGTTTPAAGQFTTLETTGVTKHNADVSISAANINITSGKLILTSAVIEGYKGADTTAVTALNIWDSGGNYMDITASATISEFTTAPQAGAWRILHFDNTPVIKDATAIECIGNKDIKAQAGDHCKMVAITTTETRMEWYTRNDGRSLKSWKRFENQDVAFTTATLNILADSNTTDQDAIASFNDVTKIVIYIEDFSTDGTDPPILQIGDSGGFETSGYRGTGANGAATVASGEITTGFALSASITAAQDYTGFAILERIAGNMWTFNSHGQINTGGTVDAAAWGQGLKELSDALTQIQITTPNGRTIGSGTYNLSWI